MHSPHLILQLPRGNSVAPGQRAAGARRGPAHGKLGVKTSSNNSWSVLGVIVTGGSSFFLPRVVPGVSDFEAGTAVSLIFAAGMALVLAHRKSQHEYEYAYSSDDSPEIRPR